ncbi:MAG: hypothetical protein IJ489_00310 [Clostridia bacterium]|nr:hypothetical protein [Clostridia bacterium]
MSEKEKIRKLEAENRRLRHENEYLRHRLALEDRSEKEKTPSKSERMFAEQVGRKSALRAGNYFGYLIERFRKSRTFRIYDRTRFAVRGIFFAKKVWTFLIWFFTLLGIGAQFLFVAGSVTVFLPAALIFSASLGFYEYFAYRKWNKYFSSLLSDQKIYFIFLSAGKTGEYLHRWSRSLAREGTVFLVSFSFRGCGFSGVVPTDENIYTIHVSYYFSLVKRLDHERIVNVF